MYLVDNLLNPSYMTQQLSAFGKEKRRINTFSHLYLPFAATLRIRYVTQKCYCLGLLFYLKVVVNFSEKNSVKCVEDRDV